MTTGFAWIVVACALYGTLHTWLAGMRVKQWALSRWGAPGGRYYRLFFNLQAALTFLPVLILAWRLPDAVLYQIPSPWSLAARGLQALALLGLAVGVLQTGLLKFIGIDILLSNAETGHPRLVTGGLYRWVRHPLYSCGLLLLWLTPTMTWNLLAMAVGLSAYIAIGIHFEERKLLREFGVGYAAYRRRTPALIPIRLPPHS